MKDTKFTPGPWRVNVGGFSSCADWVQTFSVKGPPSDFMYLEKIEDAHLIAAAPDMYEALAELVAMLSGDRRTKNAPDAIDAAFAALTKARGEA